MSKERVNSRESDRKAKLSREFFHFVVEFKYQSEVAESVRRVLFRCTLE
jgi:hypothetical protein